MIFYSFFQNTLHWAQSSFSPFLSFHFMKLFLIKMANFNYHSTVKLNFRDICSSTWTAKFNSAKMQKVCGFCEPRKFIHAKISDSKVFWHLYQTFNNNLNEDGMITSHLMRANFFTINLNVIITFMLRLFKTLTKHITW